MPARYLSDAELARLGGWPEEIADEDAVTFFTLTGDDLTWLAGFSRDNNQLGALCSCARCHWRGCAAARPPQRRRC
jgi:Domain of unknown function (DUF4158)